ncbi:proton channel OTOP1 isoform X1 [Anolis carolinensis]|uniref:proton channel OTOP1 isoform X1 n=1 Tax=Anolis carolinensis TaxID=28377 RepID=UPI002F2B695E
MGAGRDGRDPQTAAVAAQKRLPAEERGDAEQPVRAAPLPGGAAGDAGLGGARGGRFQGRRLRLSHHPHAAPDPLDGLVHLPPQRPEAAHPGQGHPRRGPLAEVCNYLICIDYVNHGFFQDWILHWIFKLLICHRRYFSSDACSAYTTAGVLLMVPCQGYYPIIQNTREHNIPVPSFPQQLIPPSASLLLHLLVTRFGVIHSVFTNLLLWTNGVLTESKHQLNNHKERLITLGFRNISIELDDHEPNCNCSIQGLCSIFSQGVYYLYPFNIEYHILASTVLYVLWKNIGRNIEHVHQHKMAFKFQGKTMGTILGLAVFITTIAIVVVYLIQIGRSKIKSESALRMFYLYAITVLTLMCVAGIVALLIYRYENKSLDVSKNPARKLDADLLVGTASGSWLLSWGSILAIILAETHPAYTWFNLPYSILVIIEKYIQNLFIIESIHREHEKVNDDIKTLRIATVSNGSTLSLAPSYKEIYNGTSGIDNGKLPQVVNGNCILPESNGSGSLDEEKSDTSAPVTPSTSDFSLNSKKRPISNKRTILMNIAAFLLLCNLSLWIPPAFGCRPEYDNGLEEMVFGFEPWIIVVNLAMPFSIFYRMHSAAALFEVSCKT